MDTRNLNKRNHTNGEISKKQFLNYLKVQESGEINMFGYSPDIQRENNYDICTKWFIDKKQEGSLIINKYTGIVDTHLVERGNGIIFDPMTGFEVDLD